MRVGSELNDKGMACWVYRSSHKDEVYLYIAQEDDFTCLPDALLERFCVLVRVMEIALSD